MPRPRHLPSLLTGLLPFFLAAASCTTTSVQDEFAEFEPTIRTEEEDYKEKLSRMFGAGDPNKTSGFDGKEFRFDRHEANLRREFDKKEYNAEEHPYFTLREKGYFSDKKAILRETAPEAARTADWQNEKNSWFSRIFSKEQADVGSKQVARTDYRLPSGPEGLQKRSYYEKKDYPLQIVDDPGREKKISRKELRSLLNAR